MFIKPKIGTFVFVNLRPGPLVLDIWLGLWLDVRSELRFTDLGSDLRFHLGSAFRLLDLRFSTLGLFL